MDTKAILEVVTVEVTYLSVIYFNHKLNEVN